MIRHIINMSCISTSAAMEQKQDTSSPQHCLLDQVKIGSFLTVSESNLSH